jgi:hypothetical protein
MAAERPILWAEILGRREVRSPRIVSLQDFSTGDWTPAEERRDLSGLVPYCLDPGERRSCYVKAGSAKAIAGATFQYLHLRERATQVVSVPWERGPLHRGPAPAAVFVFSIGRCGSTLLADMLRAGGLVSLSEPDFYTQAVTALLFEQRATREHALSRALHSMTHDLMARFGEASRQPGIIKLRAECCAAPGLILDGEGASPPTMFLVRAFEGWAASMLRVTVLSPRRLVERYVQGLRCLRLLLDNSNCHLLLYEDLVAEPENALRTAAGSLGLTIETRRLKTVLKRDAQRGSPLAREKVGAEVPRGLGEALALWAGVKPVEILRSVGLERFC